MQHKLLDNVLAQTPFIFWLEKKQNNTNIFFSFVLTLKLRQHYKHFTTFVLFHPGYPYPTPLQFSGPIFNKLYLVPYKILGPFITFTIIRTWLCKNLTWACHRQISNVLCQARCRCDKLWHVAAVRVRCQSQNIMMGGVKSYLYEVYTIQ